jgi:hypothetical protein
MKMQLGLAATVLNLPYEFFVLDMTPLDFARMKGLLLLVNKVFAADYWPWLIDRMLRPVTLWRVAMAMRPGGELGKAPVDRAGRSQWDRVEWYPPEEMWLDRQETAQADMMELQMCKTTLGEILKRKQKDLATTVRARARELVLIEKIAQEERVDPERLHKLQIPGQTDAGKGAPEKKETEREDADV